MDRVEFKPMIIGAALLSEARLSKWGDETAVVTAIAAKSVRLVPTRSVGSPSVNRNP